MAYLSVRWPLRSLTTAFRILQGQYKNLKVPERSLRSLLEPATLREIFGSSSATENSGAAKQDKVNATGNPNPDQRLH